MRNEVVLKTTGMGYVKMHGFHVNPLYMDLENWRRPTYSILSLLIPEHYNWCLIKGYTNVFLPMFRYVKYSDLHIYE